MKMNGLESPIEALAFNYLRYGFLTAVNNVWAWITVVTAAVSFWKIKALSPSLVTETEPRCLSQLTASTSSPNTLAVQEAVASVLPAKSASPVDVNKHLSKNWVLEREDSTKVKFTLHYDADDLISESDDESGEGWEDREREGGAVKLGWWCDDRKTIGDMGWYRYQDLTVLDGSVVRLWDSRYRR